VNPKPAALDLQSPAAVFGFYSDCEKLKTQQDEFNG
jgi:hypothetical protein